MRTGSMGGARRRLNRQIAMSALALAGLLVLLGSGACGDRSTSSSDIEARKAAYAPEFPPDLPFDPSGWETNEDYEPLGSPDALRVVKDEPFVIVWAAFPPTLRTDGPNSNLVTMQTLQNLIYESLIGIHSNTLEFVPGLATHWKIETNEEEGYQTFTFRINPEAKWADGSPVTADDVHATWWHRQEEDRNDPMSRMTFHEDFEEPEILDRYTVRVRTKELNWRLFIYFGGMPIYPAKEIRIPGDVYLRDYNWRLQMGSGPYELEPGSIKKGESITLRRRHDWWDEDGRGSRNTYNFEKVKFVVIRDREMEYEKFKKGELDYFQVGRAQRWVEDIPKEKIVQMGWVKRRKVFNQAPEGYSGLCFNMRKPPFDDIRVRRAFAHLFNRERLIEKLFFNEYTRTNSIFPGRDWGDEKNIPMVDFDPDLAEELLAEAGYKERDADGYLVGPNGKRFAVTLPYGVQSWERIWLVVKEDYEAAGIQFDLQLLDPATLQEKISDRQFTVYFQSWGALIFPNPETSWRSDLADKKANNNIAGFKSERVDELLRKYNIVLDREEQKAITREVDRLVCAEYPYAFGWHAGHRRMLYWDKFGHLDYYWTKHQQVPHRDMLAYWWYDPEKMERLAKARKAGEALPQGEVVVRPWEDAE